MLLVKITQTEEHLTKSHNGKNGQTLSYFDGPDLRANELYRYLYGATIVP